MTPSQEKFRLKVWLGLSLILAIGNIVMLLITLDTEKIPIGLPEIMILVMIVLLSMFVSWALVYITFFLYSFVEKAQGKDDDR